MLIRQAEARDYREVYELVKEAFIAAEHADGNEQDLVEALRKGEAFIPKLSLVAEIDGKLAGYILFTKAVVGRKEVLVLAPVAVKPAYQKQGIGAALINEGHEIAKKLCYEYSLVLGSELYYPRFGYVPAASFGIEIPEGFPPENFMAIRLRDDAELPNGSVVYAEEFGI